MLPVPCSPVPHPRHRNKGDRLPDHRTTQQNPAPTFISPYIRSADVLPVKPAGRRWRYAAPPIGKARARICQPARTALRAVTGDDNESGGGEPRGPGPGWPAPCYERAAWGQRVAFAPGQRHCPARRRRRRRSEPRAAPPAGFAHRRHEHEVAQEGGVSWPTLPPRSPRDVRILARSTRWQCAPVLQVDGWHTWIYLPVTRRNPATKQPMPHLLQVTVPVLGDAF